MRSLTLLRSVKREGQVMHLANIQTGTVHAHPLQLCRQPIVLITKCNCSAFYKHINHKPDQFGRVQPGAYSIYLVQGKAHPEEAIKALGYCPIKYAVILKAMV